MESNWGLLLTRPFLGQGIGAELNTRKRALSLVKASFFCNHTTLTDKARYFWGANIPGLKLKDISFGCRISWFCLRNPLFARCKYAFFLFILPVYFLNDRFFIYKTLVKPRKGKRENWEVSSRSVYQKQIVPIRERWTINWLSPTCRESPRYSFP